VSEDDNQSIEDLDIMNAVLSHRVDDDELSDILAVLSQSSRENLFGEIGGLLQRISALVDISNNASETLSLDELLPQLVEAVSEVLDADRATLFVHDPRSEELFSRVLVGEGINEIRFPSSSGIAGSVFTKEEAEIIPDAYADPRFNQAVDRETGYRTKNILSTVVRTHERVIGVFQVLNKHDGDFTADDLGLLTVISNQVAAALENARLYEDGVRAAAEETKLLEITNAIASVLKLDDLLAMVVGVVTDLLGADRSSLFMFDKKTDELWTRVAEGMANREIRLPSHAGLVGSCFTSGEVINIPDAYADPRFNQAVDKSSGYKTENILCAIIENKEGEKLGVIQVLNKAGGPFDGRDEFRLQAFCAQASIALQNAQLFDDVLNERNFNESILRSLSDGVITLDSDRIVTKLNDSAAQKLGWDAASIVGQRLSEVMPEQGNQWIHEGLDDVVARGVTDLAMDAEVVLQNSDPMSANITMVPLIDVKDEPIGSMIVIEDITQEKRIKSTMARYMTKEIADRLLEDGEEALGGTSQFATVLFSDIRQFTTISEELGPRATVTMLNEYFTEMVDVVFSHNGILDKYIGDAIMALFGTPFPNPDDADNALAVADGMVSALHKYNFARAAQGKMEINIGIGLSTGEVVSGNIGSEKRMDYTVIGDTVNLAARLEGATKYYGVPVLFNEITRDALTRPAAYREIDKIQVKGKNEPVKIYESLGHYNSENFPRMANVMAAFDQGLEEYQAGHWEMAMEAFREALDHRPTDGPAKLYYDRCLHYQENPPPDNWDGIWVMTSK